MSRLELIGASGGRAARGRRGRGQMRTLAAARGRGRADTPPVVPVVLRRSARLAARVATELSDVQ